MAVLSEVVDIIIPRTDTPGAKDAGVPENFDALMRNWASAQHQSQFSALVDEFGVAGLMGLTPPEQIELVRKIDAEKLALWDPVYARFKELVLTLYYLSEAGATKELRYELIPGSGSRGPSWLLTPALGQFEERAQCLTRSSLTPN